MLGLVEMFTVVSRPPPLETVGGVAGRDPGRGDLQAPPLTGWTGVARLSSLEERRAQPGQSSLRPRGLAGPHTELPHPPGPQVRPLPPLELTGRHLPVRGRRGVAPLTQLAATVICRAVLKADNTFLAIKGRFLLKEGMSGIKDFLHKL